MKRTNGAQPLSAELRSRIRAQAAQLHSSRQAADAIFAVLAESGIDGRRLSLDEWKTIVVDAHRGALCAAGNENDRRAA